MLVSGVGSAEGRRPLEPVILNIPEWAFGVIWATSALRGWSLLRLRLILEDGSGVLQDVLDCDRETLACFWPNRLHLLLLWLLRSSVRLELLKLRSNDAGPPLDKFRLLWLIAEGFERLALPVEGGSHLEILELAFAHAEGMSGVWHALMSFWASPKLLLFWLMLAAWTLDCPEMLALWSTKEDPGRPEMLLQFADGGSDRTLNEFWLVDGVSWNSK